jgi:hypothetical protein
MRRVIAIALMVAALLASTAVSAGERLFDGALGAASGALVAGPAGFLAGGVIGYVAGPRSGFSPTLSLRALSSPLKIALRTVRQLW